MYLISSQHVVLPATRLLNWDLRFSWLYFCCVPVGDAPSGHSGQKFSTFNKDQDAVEGGNCARSHLGAFWYNSCFNTNPNGVYRWGGWWNSMLLEWSGPSGRAGTTTWRASAWRSVLCRRSPGPCYSRISSSKWECECESSWFSAASDVPFSLLLQLNTHSALQPDSLVSTQRLVWIMICCTLTINEKQTQSWCDGCLHCVCLSDSLSVLFTNWGDEASLPSSGHADTLQLRLL